MLLNFREQAVAANLVNREYEGDATRGNTVKITGAVDVEIKDYKAAGRTTSADAVSDTGQDLLIDQEKVFDFYIDDIDRAQAAGSMDAYTRSAAAGLAEDADQFILATAVSEADPGNILDPTAITTGDEAHDVRSDAVSDTGQDLLIDQEKVFDFYIDDIDRAQAAGSMDAYTRSAAAGLAEDADQFILATAVSEADPGNILDPTAITTGDEAHDV